MPDSTPLRERAVLWRRTGLRLAGVSAASLCCAAALVGCAGGGPLTLVPVTTTAPAPSPTQVPVVPPTPQGTDAAPVPTLDITTAPTAVGDVSVALSRWNWIADQSTVAVGGYAEVVENGGQCTLTLTKQTDTSAVVTATSAARADAQTTICTFMVSDPSLTAGSWNLVLAYEGPSGSGVSDQQRIDIY